MNEFNEWMNASISMNEWFKRRQTQHSLSANYRDDDDDDDGKQTSGLFGERGSEWNFVLLLSCLERSQQTTNQIALIMNVPDCLNAPETIHLDDDDSNNNR